jgi:multisubunit Na+/H+ antiporter MnhB subunit
LLLALGALLYGLVPGLLEPLWHRLAATGLNPHPAHLALWHGFTPALYASAAIITLGIALYGIGQRSGWRWARIPAGLRADLAFEQGLLLIARFSVFMTRLLRFDRPLDYLPVILGFFVLLTGGFLWSHYGPGQPQAGFWSHLAIDHVNPFRVLTAVLMSLAVLGVILLKRWTTQLISLSVAGFLVTFYFVLYRAPDLALTQILVDTATLILILILLGRFPRSSELGETRGDHGRGRTLVNLLVSLGVGGVITVYILIMTATPHPDFLGRRFLATTVDLAKGTNAVNTILVDYRGLDTLFEITVLFIAMLACLGLVTRYKRTPAELKEGPLGVPGFGRHKDTD